MHPSTPFRFLVLAIASVYLILISWAGMGKPFASCPFTMLHTEEAWAQFCFIDYTKWTSQSAFIIALFPRRYATPAPFMYSREGQLHMDNTLLHIGPASALFCS
jgi:hypothetical protein